MSAPSTYSFLPWGRRGIASQINESEAFGTTPVTPTANERAQITVSVNVQTNNTTQPALPVALQIIGPGDIIGINPNAVVKTEPHNWITNFEPLSFAFIDFYEEDFPWRYSPAKAAGDQKLRPWLTLVVLKDDEFERNPIVEGAPLNSFSLTGSTPADWPLPKHDETWAWAHIQANQRLTATTSVSAAVTALNTLVDTDPDMAISRIICPRQLEENMAYTAFLIPTYEVGRLAGLGLPLPQTPALIKAQEPAWGSTLPNSMTRTSPEKFPIYYEWYFRTGATGDFEYLVRQLRPRPLDPRVGRRKMDVQDAGYNLKYTDGIGLDKATMVLEGALRIPLSPTAPYPYSPDTQNFRSKLRHFINLGVDMSDQAQAFSSSGNTWYASPVYAGASVVDDPIVSAPLYGRWHALRNRVYTNSTNWVDELNLDPRHRVAAALGGDFVRKNQEELMDKAWQQVGEVLEANRLTNWAQLVVETNQAMYRKSIESQPDEQLVAMTSRIQGRVQASTGVSVQQMTLDSRLPESAQSSTFRQIRRPNGPVMKRIDPSGLSFNDTLDKMGLGILDPAPPPPTPVAARFSATDLDLTLADSMNVAPGSTLFSITSPGVTPPVSDPQEAQGFKGMLTAYSTIFTPTNWQPDQPDQVLSISSVAAEMTAAIDPLTTHALRFNNTLSLQVLNVEQGPPDPGRIVPAMAAPSFHIPMYQSLKSLGIDFFIPNLHLMPQNTISILESNQKFIESFLVGANYEMARELLWREYPTDQRGTYFKHFWDTSDNVNTSGTDPVTREIELRDIDFIHNWTPSSLLGSHNARSGPNADESIVLAIRGDILKKFPNAVLYAIEAKWQLDPVTNLPDKTKHRLMNLSTTKKYPVFGAKVDPDITFIGFDLDANDAVGDTNVNNKPGWFFVLTERPGELRFGIDRNPDPPPMPVPTLNTWQDLNWDHVSKTTAKYINLNLGSPLVPATDPTLDGQTITWGKDSAAMAMIFYQQPVLIAIHAREMLP